MMLTEEQARTKWCPKSRSIWQHGDRAISANRKESGEYLDSDTCLGSACMMWRWAKIPANYRSGLPRDGWEHITDDEELADYDTSEPFWLEPDAERNKRRLGWCGLAGRVDHA